MKASLCFNHFSVRSVEKVDKEAGIVVTALNVVKLVVSGTGLCRG